MANELIYTSVSRGLNPGSSGFCTVAATQGLPPQMATKLEGLSGYEFHFQIADPQAPLNPDNYAHTRVTVGAETWSVLSRIAFSGADYAGRTNKIAHHFQLAPAEMGPGGPGWMLQQMAPRTFRSDYKDPPQPLPPQDLRRFASAARPAKRADAWQDNTGDAGWAGVLAKAYRDNPRLPAFVVFSPGMDLLPLFEESLAVLPPEERWAVNFATYYSVLLPGCPYHWRGVVAGSPAEKEIARFPGAVVINITKPLPRAPKNEFTEAARQGRCVARAAPTVPAAPAATGGAAIPAVPPTPPAPSQPPPGGSEPPPPKAGTAAEGAAATPPATEANGPAAAKPRSKVVPILVAIILLVILAGVGTTLFLYKALDQEGQELARHAADDASAAADARLADLLAEKVEKQAQVAIDQSKRAAKAAEAAAREKPADAARAVQEAEDAAKQAGLAAAAVDDFLSLMPKDLLLAPKPSAALIRATGAKKNADAAQAAAIASAAKAKGSLAGSVAASPPNNLVAALPPPNNPVAAVTVDAATERLFTSLVERAKAARDKAAASASDAQRFFKEAADARVLSAIQNAQNLANKAAEEANQAAADANQVVVEATRAARDAGPRNTTLAMRVDEIRRIAALARQSADEARAGGQPPALPPDVVPAGSLKVTLEDRPPNLAATAKRVDPQRNGNLFEFQVPGADTFLRPPPGLGPWAVTVEQAASGALVIRSQAPSGAVVDLLVCRLDSAGVLKCEPGPKAAEQCKELLEWFVVEVKNSRSGDVYQCPLARPKSVEHTFTAGFDVARDGKVTVLEPKLCEFVHPQPELLTLNLKEAGAKGTAIRTTQSTSLVLTQSVGRDPIRDIRLTLIVTPPAKKGGSYWVEAKTEAEAVFRQVAEKVGAELTSLDQVQADLEQKVAKAVPPLAKARQLAAKPPAVFGPVPEEKKARDDYNARLAAGAADLQAKMNPLLQKIKQEDAAIADINQRFESAKETMPSDAGKKEIDDQAAKLRKPHEDEKNKANDDLKDPTAQLARIKDLQAAIKTLDMGRQLDEAKARIAAIENETRQMMEDLTKAYENGPVEISDPWGLPIVSMKRVFQGPIAGKLLRGLAPPPKMR